MNETVETGFKDKSGRSIYVGDYVQHRLSLAGKSAGPRNYKVIKFGKNFHLVDESHADERYGGHKLTNEVAVNLVVIKSDRMKDQ